jgi:hypothetical protein
MSSPATVSRFRFVQSATDEGLVDKTTCVQGRTRTSEMSISKALETSTGPVAVVIPVRQTTENAWPSRLMARSHLSDKTRDDDAGNDFRHKHSPIENLNNSVTSDVETIRTSPEPLGHDSSWRSLAEKPLFH